MTVLTFPLRDGVVALSAWEFELLADAIEARAKAHDRQRGSCPMDLHLAGKRADELRARARQLRAPAERAPA